MNSNELHFFPIIYPDELFYSVCSRYAYYTPYKGMDKLRNDLFGISEVRLSLKFACHLAEFCKRTKNIYSPEEILQNHTVYPYFSPFLSKERQNRTLDYISYKNQNLLSVVGALRLPVNRNRVRYCPECAREDLEKHHEVYLHTIHHLDGIDYCPKHLDYLLDYPLPRCFVPERNVIHLDPEVLDLGKIIKGTKAEERLARIAGELMSLSYNQYSIETILEYLKIVYYQNDLSTQLNMNYSKIYAKILDNFSESFLKDNNLLISPEKLRKRYNYLSDLFKNRSSARPIVYLVLISLVADSFHDFIQTAQNCLSEEKFSEFNNCHNPFCPDYNKPTARRVSVKGEKEAVYRCSCGQIYTQYSDSSDHYHVVQWGNLYGESLIKLKKEGAVWKELEKKTGLTRKGIIKQLEKNEFNPIDNKLLVYENSLKDSLKKSIQENLPMYNQDYETKREFVKTYDPDFLEIFKDKVKTPHPCIPRVRDYSQEDELYFNQVSVIAQHLYKEQPPVWVSQKRIMSYFAPKVSESSITRLPKTKEALVKISENRHEFGLRKVIIKVKELLAQNPELNFTEESIRHALGMNSVHFKSYWSEVYNLFTFQNEVL